MGAMTVTTVCDLFVWFRAGCLRRQRGNRSGKIDTDSTNLSVATGQDNFPGLNVWSARVIASVGTPPGLRHWKQASIPD